MANTHLTMSDNEHATLAAGKSPILDKVTRIDGKFLGTVETLNVLLEHRKIMSECIKEMDAKALNYIPDYAIFQRVKTYTQHVKSDTRKRVQIAFSTANLLQSHIVMDADNGQGENRLYFQDSVLAVIRLCDVSLFKKLTDVQLKTHLQILNQAHQQMLSGKYNFSVEDDDFAEFIDNLFMHIGRLMSDIRQNVVKMQSLSKDLEALTSTSVEGDLSTTQYIAAKQQWLSEIVKLYERHILPVLLFLNPETTYEGLDGLHAVLSKIGGLLNAHNQDSLANNVQSYGLSFLNFYQPIEATANAVNRFIHKERNSLQRFNAIERYYQRTLIPELELTQSDNLNKKLLGNDAIILPTFSAHIKAFRRPIGYGFNNSAAYFKNLFNELEARTRDVYQVVDLDSVFATASANQEALQRMQRHTQLINILKQIELRETDDLLNMVHLRLKDQFDAYHLYDLISVLNHYRHASEHFTLKVTNLFAQAMHGHTSYKYRKIRCTKTSITPIEARVLSTSTISASTSTLEQGSNQ
jgi:hypothetical protein